MYIDRIDDFVNKLLDDLLINTFKNNKIIEAIIKEKNFIKFQKEINELIIKYYDTISYEKLKDTLINNDNTKLFDELIKKYIMTYFFLYIGYFYEDTSELYFNNIVEFSKNQKAYKLKINNVFTSEFNAKIINYYKIIKNIISILEVYNDENKIKLLIKRPEFKPAFVFLNEIGSDIIENSLQNEKDKLLKTHNLLKLIVIIEFYKKQDKKDFANVLENTIIDGDEYTYIDIVIPTRDNIDYVTIESLLTKKELMSGYTNIFWNYIVENQENLNKINMLEESHESKILKLINAGILIPVLDDFLLYHKDSERYDKNMDNNSIKDFKKREETKIKYIVTKIDVTSDLYSKNAKDEKVLANIKKNFFAPLNNRKAILVNNDEEVKIIGKLINQGSKVMTENDNFNDLANYRVYPYINFKDFKDYGFSIQMNKTVSAVRAVSLEKKGDFRQTKHFPLQMRIGGKNEFVNIVGFIIPTNLKPIECLKVNDVKDIHDYGNNGYYLTSVYADEGIVKNTPHKSSIFWMFDLDKDYTKEKSYEQTTKLTNQEQLKKLVSNFYDDIIIKIFDEFTRKIKTHKNINMQKAKKILENLEKRLVKINRNSNIYNNIESLIIENVKKEKPEYDERDDIFFGLGGTTIRLPSLTEKEKKIEALRIDVSKEINQGALTEETSISGLCQHNITWDYIAKFKKVNPTKYQDKMYEFIQNYVIENNNGDFICKSCYTQIDVKKYVDDGTFDDSGRFVTFSMPFDTPLEDLPNYEKYKIAIRNLDKIIEKIAIICNIPAYIGNIFSSRVKRKNISKDLIDIVIDNNYFLKKNFKERKQLSNKLYNISNELSNLWFFELENNIFVFSSKEKDYYKAIKYNNILAYLAILLALDINDSQLSFMTGDIKGVCNIGVFNKYGHVLFDNLRILKNKEGDTVPIKNYLVLCYIIYIISCMMTKYSMWNYEQDETVNKKKFNPIIQKIIVHSIIDILNNILENSKINKAGIIFEIISTKFYLKLNTFFNDENLFNRLKSEDQFSIANEKKTFVLPKTTVHILDKYQQIQEYEKSNFNKVVNTKYVPQSKNYKNLLNNNINNNTNCEDGRFHTWKNKNGEYVCELCNKNMKDIDLENVKPNNNIEKNNKYLVLEKTATRFCLSGEFHKFKLNKDNQEICILCKKPKTNKYSDKELDELNNNLLKNRIKKIELNDLSKENTNSIIKKLEENYNEQFKKSSIDNFLENFVNKIEKLYQSEDKKSNLRHNIYIINHNYEGNKMDKPMILTDIDNKVLFKENHPFFKMDVISYNFSKSGATKIEVFYDAITKILLGYKETSRDYVVNAKTENRININYSMVFKLKYLGLESNYINIYQKIKKMFINIEKYEKLSDKEKEEVIAKFIYDICRTRIKNLKKVIYEIQCIVNQIKNKYRPLSEEKEIKPQWNDNLEQEIIEDKSNFDKFIEKISKKITELKTSDKNNNYEIFDKWNLITDNSKTKLDLENYKFDTDISGVYSKILLADNLIELDTNGNMLLYYIIHELDNLLEFNENKLLKTYISNLIIELINYNFNLFNLEIINSSISVKRLEYILSGLTFAEDLENVITEFGTGEEEPDKIEDEQQLEEYNDAQEEEGALDMDFEDKDELIENITNHE